MQNACDDVYTDPERAAEQREAMNERIARLSTDTVNDRRELSEQTERVPRFAAFAMAFTC